MAVLSRFRLDEERGIGTSLAMQSVAWLPASAAVVGEHAMSLADRGRTACTPGPSTLGAALATVADRETEPERKHAGLLILPARSCELVTSPVAGSLANVMPSTD